MRIKTKVSVVYIAIITGVINEVNIMKAADKLPDSAPTGYRVFYGFGVPVQTGTLRVVYTNLQTSKKEDLPEMYEKNYLSRYEQIGKLCVTATFVKRRNDK